MIKKQIIDQINPKNGVSVDYFNEFAARNLMLNNETNLKNSIRDFPIKRYIEHFSEDRYLDVVNKKNKKYIDQLDEIVKVLNTFDKSDLSIDDFKRLLLKAEQIIYYR